MVASMINAAGYSTAGFSNLTTSDGIVHGQVKQSGLFSFLRIYESGHEVPFYQPLAALEMFERALRQVDIATGREGCTSEGCKTVGTPTSEYREGNATVQFEVLPANATYHTGLNAPDAESTWAVEAKGKEGWRKKDRRNLGRPRMFGKGGGWM